MPVLSRGTADSSRKRSRWLAMRKLIAFDDDTFDKLRQLARDRMATFQELADEAFADLLRKHGIPVDLKDALRKSVAIERAPAKSKARSTPARKTKS
jgi:non-homologous end joining protein Ku